MESNELFSEIILELYKNPLNRRKIKSPSLTGEGGNPVCGDRATVYLKIKKNRIVDVSFEGNGCAISIAASSLLTSRIKGKTIAEVLALTPQDLFDALGGIIQTRVKCALLSLNILKESLRRFQKDPATKRVAGLVV